MNSSVCKIQNKIELLSPAGSFDAFLAAVENGADAVYLGSKSFNARISASNFDDIQMKKAIDYAHIRNVKVYLTLNILITDNEINDAIEIVKKAYELGIDGIILQDLGLAKLLRALFNDLDLHASTQMTVYNLYAVRELEKLGFKRVVLARELTLKEIKHICRSTSLEIEVFIHGSLCISYSGQCLMSSVIGGRSGNRGSCAQPCRLPYQLTNKYGNLIEKGYLLSPRDLWSVNLVKELLEAGVKSFKIEGRLKPPEYVAVVTKSYRKLLDYKGLNEKDLKDIVQIFNRGSFCEGYLKGKLKEDIMCTERPKNWGVYLGRVASYNRKMKAFKIKLEEDIAIGDGVEVWNGQNDSPGAVVSSIQLQSKNIRFAKRGEVVLIGDVKGDIRVGNEVHKTSSKELIQDARKSYLEEFKKKIDVKSKIWIKRGKLPCISICDESEGINIFKEGSVFPEEVLNKNLSNERIVEQIKKTKNTPFRVTSVETDIDDGMVMPISQINNLRREALDELGNIKASTKERKLPEDFEKNKNILLNFPGNSRTTKKVKVSVYVYRWNEQYEEKFLNTKADRIYIPFSAVVNDNRKKAFERFREKNRCELFVWIPNIIKGNYERLLETKLKDISGVIDGISIGNIGELEYIRDLEKITIVGDLALNVLNSQTLLELKRLNLDGVTLSPELDLGNVGNLVDIQNFQKEALVYGRIPVMTSEYCPIGRASNKHKNSQICDKNCREIYTLIDRMGVGFPMFCENIDCRAVIFNAKVLFAVEALERIKKCGIDTVRLNITDESPEEIEELVALHKDILNKGKSGIEKYKSFINKVKAKGFTRGRLS